VGERCIAHKSQVAHETGCAELPQVSIDFMQWIAPPSAEIVVLLQKMRLRNGYEGLFRGFPSVQTIA
jgi:hypothetical protein